MKRFSEYIGDWRAPAFLAVFLVGDVALSALWWGALNQDEGLYLYAAPACHEVPFDRQKRLLRCVKEKDGEPHFGQNATTLLLVRRKAPEEGA